MHPILISSPVMDLVRNIVIVTSLEILHTAKPAKPAKSAKNVTVISFGSHFLLKNVIKETSFHINVAQNA